jgi:hypothetical protein
MKTTFALLVFALSSFCNSAIGRADIVTFEGLLGSPNSFNNGGPSSNSNGFTVGSVFLPNMYDSNFDFWTGWALSNVANATTPGFSNQYAAFPGRGGNASDSYAVAYDNTFLNFAQPTTLDSLQMSNTTYAALSMRDGDRFAKKFGGPTGLDPDFFKVTVRGFSETSGNGIQTGSLEAYLADYRFDDSQQDFIRNDWLLLDLRSLGSIRSLRFDIDSSDVGNFGINTPTYFALDNITISAVPEPRLAILAVPAVVTLVMIGRYGARPRKKH